MRRTTKYAAVTKDAAPVCVLRTGRQRRRWGFYGSIIIKLNTESLTFMLYGAMNFPVSPVLKEIETISSLQFDYLELTMDPPQAHFKVIRQKRDKLLKALEDLNMGLVCHLPSFVSTADLTDSIREASLNEMLQSLEVAADLPSIKVVIHPSFMMGLSVFVMDKVRKYALKSIEVMVERAESLGLTLCIENLFPRSNSLVEPDHFEDIFERFPTLRMTLDIGHANIEDKGRRRATDFIERFSHRIDHIHASDNFGGEDNHIPLGTGTVDFHKIIKALKGIGYDKTITIEVFSRDRDYLRISREKLAAMFAFI
ncbi:MAG: sugar phosphate isomerase/epimerase [Pseudomonadota bacterium]